MKDLAEQTHDFMNSFKQYLTQPQLRCELLIGGTNPKQASRALQEGVDIITGTPGGNSDKIFIILLRSTLDVALSIALANSPATQWTHHKRTVVNNFVAILSEFCRTAVAAQHVLMSRISPKQAGRALQKGTYMVTQPQHALYDQAIAILVFAVRGIVTIDII